MKTDILNSEKLNILQTYKRLPISVKKALGVKIFSEGGEEYLDFLGGIAVNTLGHSHPDIINAVKKQIERYMHVSNYFYQDSQVDFAGKIKAITGYDKVFFCNSGTEATEGAIKLVRRWGSDYNKQEIIAFSGGFHGRTYGALSLMDKPHYKDKMGPYLPNMKIIKYNDIEELEETISAKTCALLLEFVQGEGGVTTADADWFETIRNLQTNYGFKIIADEIQSGAGRTGKFFGFEHYNIRPDIVTLAKGIGGGLPLGCILINADMSNVFEKGMHGTTFGGNPVACAAGSVVLDKLSSGLMEHVVHVGNYLGKKLEDVKDEFPEKVLEIRGFGLMRGIKLSFDASILVDALLERKIITNSASGTVLRLVPPLIIDKSDIDSLISELKYCLAKL